MKNRTEIVITRTPAELGDVARIARDDSGLSLRQSAKANSFGVRFLSEFERGKPTAELGKVMQALHAVGFDLAVVPRQKTRSINAKRLSKQLELEFPYDWSNPDISESTLIFLVLEKARFNDVLRITHYFGIERISTEAMKFSDTAHSDLITKYLRRIKKGIELASAKNHIA